MEQHQIIQLGERGKWLALTTDSFGLKAQ